MHRLFIISSLFFFLGQSISNNFTCDINEVFTTHNSRDSYSKDDSVNRTPKKILLNNCSLYKSVIDNDLKPFEQGIEKNMFDSVTNRGTRYQIVNHRLYRQKDCMFPSRCSGVEYFIKKLLPELPDMDIILNCRDWPQLLKNQGNISPIFSFSKTKDYLDIMYPTWGFWEGGPAISLYPTGLGRWDKHRISITEASKKFPWDNKTSKAFFRGSRTSDERDSLVLLSRKNSDIVDAQYTKNQAWKSPKDTLDNEPASEVTLEEHCKYKFLFNFRGVAASFRFKHLFLCKSLVFHVGSEWKEFFYDAMLPGIHYVPVKSYPSQRELEDIIKYYQEHDNEARSIAEKGYNFIRKHLRMKDVVCYWEYLLKRYGALIKYKVVVNEDFIPLS